MMRRAASLAIVGVTVLCLLAPATSARARPASGAPGPPDLASLQPAGDLLGNGRQDVLDVRASGYSSAGPYRAGITARDGRSGRALWHRSFQLAKNESVEYLTLGLGPRRKRGVLSAVSGFDGGSAGDLTTVRLTAMAGRDGHTLWTTTFTGTYDAGAMVSDVHTPYFQGVIGRGPHHGPSLLVDSETGGGTSFTTSTFAVSPVDGATRSFLPPQSSPTTFPQLVPVGDLNGDHVPDFVREVFDTGTLDALSGANGRRLWTASGLPGTGVYDVVPVGHVTSAHRADIAVVEDRSDPDSTVSLVRGVNGQVRWHRPGFDAYAVGKAGRHLVPAVVVAGGGYTATPTKYSVTQSYAAVDSAGSTLYSHSVSATVYPATASSDVTTFGDIYPLGDTQGDGAIDLGLEVGAFAGGVGQEHRGVIEARTGAFRQVDASIPTAGSLRHGSATDLLAGGLVNEHPSVTAWRGSSLARYFHRVIPAFGSWLDERVLGLHATGSSCSDIAVEVSTLDHGGLGLLYGSGAPRWFVSFPYHSVVGGTVHRFVAPTHACA